MQVLNFLLTSAILLPGLPGSSFRRSGVHALTVVFGPTSFRRLFRTTERSKHQRYHHHHDSSPSGRRWLPLGRVSRMSIGSTLTSASNSGVTELPDSLQDSALRAAEASVAFAQQQMGVPGTRCRVDFDTSMGDETFPLLKTSTEFMQSFVSAMCYAMIPGLQTARQEEMMRVSQAKAQLKALEEAGTVDEKQEDALIRLIARSGREEGYVWKGPVARVYFPDEGNAALARRDWLGERPRVPACVQFSACGGVQKNLDVSNDLLVFFFCPKASESQYVEEILQRTELEATQLQLTVLVNPNLVDMGVTGYGVAGRLLRERLIDRLECTYYLRTLSWGALTRQWPRAYSVWQEDSNEEGGYRLIRTLDRLPSNPEVEDIYEIENGLQEENRGAGFLDQLGDFVNGMMRL